MAGTGFTVHPEWVVMQHRVSALERQNSSTSALRSAVVALAMTRFGAPYVWGANGPDAFDCSGFIVWLFNQVGVLSGDMTSQQLHASCKEASDPPLPGDLVFYGHGPDAVTHVMLYIGFGRCIGAHGAGSECKTVEDAKRLGAKVDIQPIGYRKDKVAIRTWR